MASICKKKLIFWPIFYSLFSYKSRKDENEINLAFRTEETCSMNIQFKNQLDSSNTFLVIVVTVSKKIVLRKTRLKFKFNPFSIVHRFEKHKK